MLGTLDRTGGRLMMKLSTDGLWGGGASIRARSRSLDGTLDRRNLRRARTRLCVRHAGSKYSNHQKRNSRSTHNPLQTIAVAAPNQDSASRRRREGPTPRRFRHGCGGMSGPNKSFPSGISFSITDVRTLSGACRPQRDPPYGILRRNVGRPRGELLCGGEGRKQVHWSSKIRFVQLRPAIYAPLNAGGL